VSLSGGIDVGGTKIQTVVIDDTHTVLGEARCATPTKGGPPPMSPRRSPRRCATQPRSRRHHLGAYPRRGRPPGEIGSASGTVTSARNLPGWEGSYPLAAVLEGDLGARVALGNDVQVATDAEAHLGAGRPYRSMLGVFWGTGVGGEIILDGTPWLGLGGAAEIGHIVVKLNGARCLCGRRGCMEAYAGRGALERRTRRRHAKGAETELLKIMKKRDRPRMTSRG
jgi:glucokinase